MQRIHCKPLQARNLNRLLVVAVHHARALAQHLDRTCPRATRTKNIRVKDRVRRALHIPRRNLLDKSRHIDMRRASIRARRIEAVKAAIRLNHRSLLIERRVQVPEALLHLRLRSNPLVKSYPIAHLPPITSDTAQQAKLL